jgi:small-conductance mechanosensitive channel
MRFFKIISLIIFLSGIGGLKAHSMPLLNRTSVSNEFEQKTRKQKDTILIKKLTLSELVRKSTSDGVYLDKIENRILDSASLAKIFERVDASDATVKELLKDPRNKNLNSLTFRKLQNLKSLWNSRRARIVNYIDALSDQIDDLNEEKEHIEELTKFWNEFPQKKSGRKINKVLRGKITKIESSARKVFPKFDKQLNTLLIKLDELSNLSLVIDDYVEKINFVLTNTATDYFSLGVKPIWSHHKEFDGEAFNSNLSVNISRYITDQKGVLYDHLDAHIFLIFVFLILLYVIRRVSKNPEIHLNRTYPFLENISLVFKMRAITALFLTLLFSIVLYKDAVAIFMQSLLAAEIVFFLILANKVITRNILKQLILLVVFYYGLKLVDIFSHQEYVGHILLLVINILFLVWLVKTKIKKYFISGLEFSKSAKTVSVYYVNIVGITVIFTLITNIIGYINVSYFLFSATVGFSLFGIILYFWYAIMNNMLYVFLQMKKSDKFKLMYRERNIIFKYLSRILWLFSIGLLIYVLFTVLAIKFIVVNWFWNLMEAPIEIGSFSITLSNIALFFIIIWFSMVIARFIQTILRDEILVRAKFDRGLPATISMLVRYSIITVGFFIALSAMGFEFSQLTVIIGALSVGIGFGLQNIFNNLVSGLILIFERPIHIDDTIEVNNMVGLVRSIGIRTSNIRTLDGAEVIIPNGLLISNEVINWTLSDKKRRIEVNVGVAYGSDVKKVTKLLYHVLKEHDEAVKFPPPMVIFDEFADSSLNFRLLFWTDNYSDWLRIKSDILFGVNDILEKENIVIPFPQRDVHMYPKQ